MLVNISVETNLSTIDGAKLQKIFHMCKYFIIFLRESAINLVYLS